MPGAPEVRTALDERPARGGDRGRGGRAAGMKTLRDRCLDLVRDGVTTFDEFARLRL